MKGYTSLVGAMRFSIRHDFIIIKWRGRRERRTIISRYGPKYVHWTGGTYTTAQPQWVSELTNVQKAVLEPPYIYNRFLIVSDCETLVRPRLESDGPPTEV